MKLPGEKIQIYSTEECIIGKWIDGRPLYRKVIELNNVTLEAAKQNSFAHGISNFGSCINARMIGKNGINYVFPYLWANGTSLTALTDVRESSIRITSSDKWASFYAYIILEYTKTTD